MKPGGRVVPPGAPITASLPRGPGWGKRGHPRAAPSPHRERPKALVQGPVSLRAAVRPESLRGQGAPQFSSL